MVVIYCKSIVFAIKLRRKQNKNYTNCVGLTTRHYNMKMLLVVVIFLFAANSLCIQRCAKRKYSLCKLHGPWFCMRLWQMVLFFPIYIFLLLYLNLSNFILVSLLITTTIVFPSHTICIIFTIACFFFFYSLYYQYFYYYYYYYC